jgi:hypothetical protein
LQLLLESEFPTAKNDYTKYWVFNTRKIQNPEAAMVRDFFMGFILQPLWVFSPTSQYGVVAEQTPTTAFKNKFCHSRNIILNLLFLKL